MHSYSSYPFNLEFYVWSHWNNRKSIHLQQMLTDKKCDVFDIVWYAMSKAQFRHQVLVQKVSALIGSISKWSTIELEIEWTKRVWIDPNIHWINLVSCHPRFVCKFETNNRVLQLLNHCFNISAVIGKCSHLVNACPDPNGIARNTFYCPL